MNGARAAAAGQPVAISPGTRNRLLGLMLAEDRAALEARAKPVTFKAGQAFFEPGQMIETVHFIEEGVVSGIILLQNGASVEAMIVGREGVVGALAYAGPVLAFGRAVGQIPGKALSVESAVLRDLVAERPHLRSLLERYSLKMQIDLAQSLACNALHRLEQRLSKWLLRCHDRVDGDTLVVTQEALAQMLASQRTTVSEMASTFQRQGLIGCRRGKIDVKRREQLERLTCECYATVVEREREFDIAVRSRADRPG